jgi:signal transduction histidine kinase
MTDWAIVAVGVVAVAVTAISQYIRLQESSAKIREKRIRLEMEMRDRDSKASYDDDPALQQLRDQMRHQSRLIEQLAARDVVVNVRTDTAGEQPEPSARGVAVDLAPVESVVREISHSINTPLSQIEIALSLLAASNDLREEDRRAVERAAISVALCKAFLQAFRYVVLPDSENAREDDGQDLGDLISRAALVTRATKDVKFDISVPATLEGYEPTFIIAMILPLIENAIDASPDGSLIRIWSDGEKGVHHLYVANPYSNGLLEKIYEPMFSTKQGHDGMGLAVVQRLVDSVPGAKLDHSCDAGIVRFSIQLPERAV